LAVLVRLALALAIGLSPGQPASAQVAEAFDCTLAGFEVASPAGVTCGWLTLPEDHADAASGRGIKVAVVVVRASGPDRRADPIVFLNGGPGAAIVESTALLAQTAFARDVLTRDLVVIDQRGTGLSQPRLDCPEISAYVRHSLQQPHDHAVVAERYFEQTGVCLDRLQAQDINLARYTSAQSAADVVDVARALGYSSVNLYGLSYGTRLALTIVRDFGVSGIVRSAALGGVYGPDANALQVPVGLAERLERVFDACAADAPCNQTYGDLRRVLVDLLASLRSADVAVEVPDPTTGMLLRGQADDVALLEGLLDALGSSDGIASLPARLTATARGDSTLLVDGLRARLIEADSVAWGMNIAVQCQEELLLIDDDEQRAVAAAVRPGFEGFALRFPESSPLLPGFCVRQGLLPRPTFEAAPVSSATVPVLAISGAFDPFTPPEWAERATARFARRSLVTLPAAGHDTALAGLCPVELVSRFLDNPDQTVPAACIDPPRFVGVDKLD
jgi:pimeloyl-ACP methyl ester carboxylesterase